MIVKMVAQEVECRLGGGIFMLLYEGVLRMRFELYSSTAVHTSEGALWICQAIMVVRGTIATTRRIGFTRLYNNR